MASNAKETRSTKRSWHPCRWRRSRWFARLGTGRWWILMMIGCWGWRTLGASNGREGSQEYETLYKKTTYGCAKWKSPSVSHSKGNSQDHVYLFRRMVVVSYTKAKTQVHRRLSTRTIAFKEGGSGMERVWEASVCICSTAKAAVLRLLGSPSVRGNICG